MIAENLSKLFHVKQGGETVFHVKHALRTPTTAEIFEERYAP